MRKHVLEYDDVMNVQRKVIYAERRKVLEGQGLRENVLDMIARQVTAQVEQACAKDAHPEDWDLEALLAQLALLVPALGEVDPESLRRLPAEDVSERLVALALEAYEKKEAGIGAEMMREIERLVLLQTIDRKWIDHLHNMDALREGIGLRAYAQSSPLVEYQREGYDLFQDTMQAIQEDTARMLFRVQVAPEQKPVARPVAPVREPVAVGAKSSAGQPKLGRNDPCWCGSGKKYKKCHGREA
jgi:preprotein translocase subunit SecA